HGTFSIDAAAQLAGKPSMMNPEGNLPKAEQNGSGQEPIKMVMLNNEAKAAVQPLLSEYLALKNALASDDFDAAKNSIQSFGNVYSKIDQSLFEGESHEVWIQYSKEIEQAAK